MNLKSNLTAASLVILSASLLLAQGKKPDTANESPTVDNTVTRPNDPYRMEPTAGAPTNPGTDSTYRAGTPGTENRGGTSGNTVTHPTGSQPGVGSPNPGGFNTGTGGAGTGSTGGTGGASGGGR